MVELFRHKTSLPKILYKNDYRHFDQLDEETQAMSETLANINELGCLTLDSQDGKWDKQFNLMQRAYIEGWVPTRMFPQILKVFKQYPDLWVLHNTEDVFALTNNIPKDDSKMANEELMMNEYVKCCTNCVCCYNFVSRYYNHTHTSPTSERRVNPRWSTEGYIPVEFVDSKWGRVGYLSKILLVELFLLNKKNTVDRTFDVCEICLARLDKRCIVGELQLPDTNKK
jgi:hypothetical protein